MIKRILFLLLMVQINAHAIRKDELKTGDLIFQNLDCGPMCDAIEAVTKGYNNKPFSHMGMVYILQDNIFIIESIGAGVQLTPLERFISRTKHAHWVGRIRNKYQHLIPKATGFALMCEGMPYDDEFLYGNGKYYCSELIYDAFKAANNGKPFFELKPMTFKAPGAYDYFPVWQQHFLKLDMPIPEGALGCNPGGISLSKKIQMLGLLE